MPAHGGQLAARALKEAGVEVIFTLSGGHIMPIYDGCIDEGIRIVDVRHEQVAAHAADGYARQTGKPGCAVVTAGPGTTSSRSTPASTYPSPIAATAVRTPPEAGPMKLASWAMRTAHTLAPSGERTATPPWMADER